MMNLCQTDTHVKLLRPVIANDNTISQSFYPLQYFTYYTMPQLPASRGSVFVREAGQFYGPNETLNPEPTEQLPQFLPRVDWPQRSRPRGQYFDPNGPPLDRNEAQVMNNPTHLAARAKWDHDNPDLSPMPPYQHASNAFSGRPRYNTFSIWHDHAMILYNLLTETLEKRNWLSEDDITELLTCVSYGMHQSMTWLHNWTFEWQNANQKGGDGRPFHKELNPDFGIYTVVNHVEDYLLDPSQRDSTLRRILGRRWIAVPINQFQYHWIMTLFDRQEGQLYIFDGVKMNRKDRIEAAVHMWAKFWKNMGMPWHFQYFVVPVEQQQESWECGIIGIAWIIAALRNRASGDHILATDASIHAEDFVLNGHIPDDYEYQDSSIALPDWLPPGCKSGGNGADAVRRMFQILIANELGLQNHKVMTASEKQSTKTKTKEEKAKHKKTAWGRIDQVVQRWKEKAQKTKNQTSKDAQNAPDDMILVVEDFYTGAGGLQFSWPLTQLPREYDPKAERTHYSAHQRTGEIDFSPQRLAAEATLTSSKMQYVQKPLLFPTQATAIPAAPTQAMPVRHIIGYQDPKTGFVHDADKFPRVGRESMIRLVLESYSEHVLQNNHPPTKEMRELALRYLQTRGLAEIIEQVKTPTNPTLQKTPAGDQDQSSGSQAKPVAPTIQHEESQLDNSSTIQNAPQQDASQHDAPQQGVSQQDAPQKDTSHQTGTGNPSTSVGIKRGRDEDDEDDDEGESDSRKAKRLRQNSNFWRNMSGKDAE